MRNLYQKQFEFTVGIYDGDKVVLIEDTVTGVSWGGSIDTAARYFKVTCQNFDGKNDFAPGRLCILHSLVDGEQELFRGFVTERAKQSSDHSITYSAYDCRWYLTKNKFSRIFRNMTATEIIIDIFKTFGIPYNDGDMADTGVRFSKFHVINKTLWDTVLMALTETTKQSGVKYTTKVVGGKISLLEKRAQTKKVVVEQGINLVSSSFSDSMEAMYTHVVVNGKTEDGAEIQAAAVNEEASAAYGMMQEIIDQSDEVTQAELNQIAAQKLKELSRLKIGGKITTVGLYDVEAGDAIYVVDEETGLVGGFYVDSDEHSASGGNHTVTLTLSWTDEVAAMEYEPPKEEG